MIWDGLFVYEFESRLKYSQETSMSRFQAKLISNRCQVNGMISFLVIGSTNDASMAVQ